MVLVFLCARTVKIDEHKSREPWAVCLHLPASSLDISGVYSPLPPPLTCSSSRYQRHGRIPAGLLGLRPAVVDTPAIRLRRMAASQAERGTGREPTTPRGTTENEGWRVGAGAAKTPCCRLSCWLVSNSRVSLITREHSRLLAGKDNQQLGTV
jgi:hypothetical protein